MANLEAFLIQWWIAALFSKDIFCPLDNSAAYKSLLTKKKTTKRKEKKTKNKRVSLLLWEAKGICVIIYTMHITLVSKHYISGIASIKGIKSAASA